MTPGSENGDEMAEQNVAGPSAAAIPWTPWPEAAPDSGNNGHQPPAVKAATAPPPALAVAPVPVPAPAALADDSPVSRPLSVPAPSRGFEASGPIADDRGRTTRPFSRAAVSADATPPRVDHSVAAPIPPPAPAPAQVSQKAANGRRRPARGLLVAMVAIPVLVVGGLVGWLLRDGSSPSTSPAAGTSVAGQGATPASGATVGGSQNATTPSAPSASSPSASSSSPTDSTGFGIYTNPRFGFTTLFPQAFVEQTQNPVDNGTEWVGGTEGTVSLRVYGWNNTNAVTPEAELATLQQQGMRVTYHLVDGNVLTASGLMDHDATIVYIREVIGPGSVDRLRWAYPADQKQLWDDAVTQTARKFSPGDVSVQH